MATNASTNRTATGKTYFEQQREGLVGEIAITLEQVLQNLNKLNRSLEGVIAVCGPNIVGSTYSWTVC